MRAFRVLLILGICLFSKSITWAQEPEQHKCLIRVNQTFHGWVKCNSHTPVWLSTDVTISDTTRNFTEEDKRKGYIDILLNAQNRGGHYYFGEKLLTFKMILDAGELNNSPVGDWVIETEEIKVGKKDFPKKSVSHSCGFLGLSSEGFDATTCLIFDNPIDIKTNSNDVVVENESLELLFNEFYENGQKVELQYRCVNAGIEEWQPISNKSISIRSGGKLRLSYEDVVGKESDSNEAYKNCSGKFIEFRVVKTLLDENYTKTYGNIVKIRFYHKGPEFTIEDIRRPYCESFTIYVRKNSPTGSFQEPNSKYLWLLQKKDSTLICDSIKFEGVKNSSDLYKLTPQKPDDIVKLNGDSASGEWVLQLQLLNDDGRPESLDFNEVSFSIPKQLPKIEVTQDTTSLFTYKGINYHLFSAKDPYVVLNITDDDHSELGRMPYKVYDSAGKLLAEITDKIDIKEDSLRGDFKEEYVYDNLATEWAKEWFGKNTNLAKVERIEGGESNVKSSSQSRNDLLKLESQDGYTYFSFEPYSTLYKIKGKLTFLYGFTGKDNWYIGKVGETEEYVLVGGNVKKSATDIGELISEGNTFILSNKDGKYYMFNTDPEYKTCNECTLPCEINTNNAHLNCGAEIVSINDKNVKLYVYDKENHIWNLKKEVVTQFKPISASSVVFKETYTAYTSVDFNSYREYYEISEGKFIENFQSDKAVYLPKKAFKERYKRLWQQYYLQNAGYHVHGINVNQDDKLTLIDNDGCPYTIPYRVNVLNDIVIAENNRTNPSGANLSDDSITLTVSPGGKETYYYKGEAITKGKTIGLTDLPWGETEVEFTDKEGNVIYTYKVSLLPNVKFNTKSQTCVHANGAISPSGDDVGKCSQWQHKNPSKPDSDEDWENGLDNLKAGMYAVRGKFGDLWVDFGNQTVANEIFSIEVNNVKDATEIGGTGSVELKIENQTKDITWTDLDTQATYTDYKQAIFTARKYHWSATHSSDGCTLPIEFEIKAPKVELVNASVIYNADTKEAHVHVEGKKNDLVSSYQFTVDGKTFANDTTLSGKNAGDGINLGLKYVSSQDNKTNTTKIEEIKLLSYAPQVTVDTAYNNKRCPSHLGRVTLSGASGGELAVDNSNQYEKIEKDGFQYIPNNPNDTIHTLHFRKTETIGANYDFGKIENTIVHDVCNVVIAEPKQPYIRIAKLDVTCKGSGNGELYIDDAQNVRGAAQYSLDKKEWYLSSDTIKGQVPKVYHIYTRDSVCPSDIYSCDIEIEEPTNKLQVSIADNGITNPTCANNDGKIVLKASGGWDDYLAYTRKLTAEEYENALDTTDIEKNLRIEGLEFGNHTIYVHDGGGCVVAVEAELKQYYSPQIINTTAIPARCYGSADGEIVINAVTVDCSVEDKPLSLLFEGRSDTLILTNPYKKTTIKDLSKGYYTLRVSDANECKSDEITVHISQPEPLKLEARLLDEGRIQYNGGSDGRMKITVSGGNSGNNNIVTYGDGLAVVHTGVPYIVEGMSEGPIEISAKDEKGCPSNDTTLTFIEPKEPITIEAESQPALCHAMTGSVKVTATGGWGGHKIRLVGERESRNSNDKQSKADFESLYAGDYEIEVEDKHGAKVSQRVRVDAPEPISHEFAMTPDHCDGNGGGMIELSGGTGDYVSLFNMGADSIHGNRILVGNLVGGREYTLTTWDANRCESRMTFTMPDEQLRAEIKYAYNANGSATLTAEVKGGIAPYTYKWRNVSGGEELGTSSTQTVTKSGIYRLEIADASGCSYNTMQDVLMAGSIVMRVKSVTRATNPENNNGTATIICKATQPTDLRLYHLETDTWTSSITMQDETTIKLEGLRPGHYSVEGELGDGSKQMAQFYIAPYEPMEVTKLDVKHVSAPGRSDARVVVDFVGGIAPYTVNDTATYETSHIELTNLAAGSIALSVADSTGNVLTKNVEILEPEPLVVTPSRVDSASCFSYSDGSVQLTATGGWPGYQFANGNGDYRNSAYFGELNAGERTFKVVDKYGVEDSVKVTVSEPDMLRALVSAIDSVSCKGLNDGAAHFTLTGGTAPYRTIYEKETLDGTDVAHLLSGSYVMKFTDSHNCKSPDTISIYIPEPDLLELANDYVTHTTCELDNGKIAIEVKGGSLPYRYEWKENGATYGGAKTVNMVRSEAENLKQNGLYHIDITDLHGCHTQYEMRIEHSENPRVMGVATTDVLCYGSSDGIAEVDSSQVKWGYPKVNYHLTWPQGQTGVMSVNTLTAGTHTVRITDDNNCTTTREFTVGTPEPVKNHLASVRDALCYGYSDGRIETHTTGGVGDYTYVWNTDETTSYADSLKAGLYTIVVTDSHECIDSATYEVGEPEELKVNLGNDVLICPGNVHVFDAGEYATYSWRHAASGEEIATERYLATGDEGDYAIKVTDEIGCIARDTVNITIGENALEANFLMASDAAVNDTIMLVELSNLPVDSVRWEYEPLTVVDIDDAESYMLNLSAENTGRYYITMWAYSGGCESFEQKFIDIYEAVADTSDFKIGYDPLIKQAKVSPNPNDGEFDLIVVLRETYDIDVTVYDVNNGRQVEHVVLKDSDRYNTRLNIRQWGSGIFVLSVSSGTERRAIKVLCVR